MKTIIAGSRDIGDYDFVKKAIVESGFKITEVISGCATGVDTLGEQWAKENNIPIKRFPADWKQYGMSAGPRRNTQMGDYGDALIAIPSPDSRGTLHMVSYAKSKGLKVFTKQWNPSL